VVGGVGAAAPFVLRVGDHLHHGVNASAALHGATVATFVAALAVGLVVATGAAIEHRRRLSSIVTARIHRGVATVAIATLVLLVAGGLAVAGNPVTRVRHGWATFKGGYAADSTGGNRLVSGLGSNRYDFYRVALDEFAAHPILGIGVDNFQQQYLKRGRSEETPHYPHSIELRTLTETGLVGTLLAVAGLGAALVAAARGLRGPDLLGRAVVAAALAGFAYWAVHGSFDWFWEFAGLGAPAFALLGIACALASRPRERQADDRPYARSQPESMELGPVAARQPGHDTSNAAAEQPLPRSRCRSSGRRRLGTAAIALLALAAAVSLAAPWLSQLQIQSAARIWKRTPQAAFSRLNDAAQLNPLSDEAYLVAGSIALRFGDLARADHEFALALARTPGDAYAMLERGAIVSTENDRHGALELLERAGRLNPRDPLTREALRLAREGKRVDVEELNRSILLKAQELS
jgi:tetratricopeptide (TPR) repeat protein